MYFFIVVKVKRVDYRMKVERIYFAPGKYMRFRVSAGGKEITLQKDLSMNHIPCKPIQGQPEMSNSEREDFIRQVGAAIERHLASFL